MKIIFSCVVSMSLSGNCDDRNDDESVIAIDLLRYFLDMVNDLVVDNDVLPLDSCCDDDDDDDDDDLIYESYTL